MSFGSWILKHGPAKCKHTIRTYHQQNSPQNAKKKGSGLTEVALGVDEEVVGAEPGHVGGAHVGIVPLQLLVPLLLLLRQVAGCKRQDPRRG